MAENPGRDLDPAVREYLEPRFAHDFSHLRVHTDSSAAESPRSNFGEQDRLLGRPRITGYQAGPEVLPPSRVPASDARLGKPLDSATRSQMEPLLGADFSQVRVHADADGPPGFGSSRVPAYTIGHHIYLAGGRYAPPHTQQQSWILAHELAHVAQQTRSGKGFMGAPADAAEQEARAAADAITANKPFAVEARTGVCLACAPPTPTPPQPAPAPTAPAGLRIIREWAAPDGFVIDIEVGRGVARLGLEKTLPSGTEVGLAGWHRAHSSGAGVGAESGRAIRYAPPEVNLGYQNAGIERFVREFNQERASDVRLFLRTVTTTHPNSLRLASITYRLSAARGSARASNLFEVTINIDDSRDNPRVWVEPPTEWVDWKTFLRPRPRQVPAAGGAGPAAAQEAPSSGTSAGAKAKPAGGGPPATAAEGPGADVGARPVKVPPATDVEPPTVAGGGAGPAPEAPGPTAPRPGRFAGVGAAVGSAALSLGIGLLSSYLKMRADRKIAAAQIDRNQAKALQTINGNLDIILKMMMTNPEQTLYARVLMSSAVITTFEATGSPEPTTSDSAPIIELYGIFFTFVKLDPALADTFGGASAGGLHFTMVRRLISEIPLETPPIEDLIALAKDRKLPLDELYYYVLGKAGGVDKNEKPEKYIADVDYWTHILDLIKAATARP